MSEELKYYKVVIREDAFWAAIRALDLVVIRDDHMHGDKRPPLSKRRKHIREAWALRQLLYAAYETASSQQK